MTPWSDAGRRREALRTAGTEALDAALARTHRDDPVLPRSGGPAGNADLTAWTGMVLLVLFLAELVTLVDVRGLIGWHLAIGVVLGPPALLKTATTGWRILRYYSGHGPYHRAGPPPLVLRALGPLVVAATLGLIGTGLVLVLLGEETSHRTLVSLLGQRADAVTLHQAFFAVWAVVTGVHVLGRLLPAWTAVRRAPVPTPGRLLRVGVLATTLVLSAGAAGWVLGHDGGWSHQDRPGTFAHHDEH